MTVMKIEVVPDTSRPAGGHAIIRLRGVALLPPGATFRIEPIDETMNDGDTAGWPTGDLRPLETRQTADGVEMRVGPDVVDAPLLEPGTPVTITVPDGHLSAELVWPDLPVSSGISVAPVVMTPSQMASELAATERTKADAAVLAAEAALRAEEERLERARREAIAAEASRLATAEKNRMAEAARELEAALATEPSVAAKAANGAAHLPQAAAANDPRVHDRALSSLSKQGGDRDRAAPVIPAAEPDMSLPAIVLKRANEATTAADAAPVNLRPQETIEGHLAPLTPQSRLLPFLAGAGAAGLAAAAILAVLALRPGNGGPVNGAATGVATTKSALADAFAAGAQSPRGELATDVDLPTALRLADYNLHGVDRPIDRAEAEFWLKKAMSLTASHAQLRWAMTQLGTLSAEPVNGTPDYEKARLLWEIAAANGDPVAMCFLGTLAEYGLGVPANRMNALDHFKRSKEAGGCPNSDEAIARLSK
jgi:TPR repeat protein